MHERKRGPLARFNAGVRGVLLTCAVVVGGLLVAWLAVRSQVNDEIRREVERRFAAQYREFRVSVRHARMFEGRGVEIHGLSVARRVDNRPLVYVDEIFAECPIDAEALLTGKRPATERVLVSGLKVWVQRQEDGSWDIQRLWPLPKLGASSPPVTVRDGSVEVTDPRGGLRRTLNLRSVCLEIASGQRAASPAHDGASGGPPPMRVSGRFAGEHFESVEFQAQIDRAPAAWSVSGTVRGLQWSRPLHASLPLDWQRPLASACAVSGRLDLGFTADSGAASAGPMRFLVKGSLADGQIQDGRLPYRLYDARAQLEADNHHLRLDQGFARNGAMTVTLQMERRGWQDDSPLTLTSEARRLELDRRFLEVLPKDLQAQWRKYFPAGSIDARLRLDFDGRRWAPELAVACHDVSFAYHRFPYRLERGRGTVQLQDNRLQIDLTAAAGGQDVTIRGDVHNPGEQFTGWIEFGCQQPIPLDEKLLAALVDPQARDVVRSLRPSGMLAVQGRLERTDPADPGLHRRVQIELFNCSMNYDRFPYPLGMIRGRLLWDDRGWTFQELSGRNDTAYVEATGFWRRVPGAGSELALNLVGADVPLEDELRDALQPGAQLVWNQLRPRGTVDHVQVDIRYASAPHRLDVEVSGQKWKRRTDHDEGHSVTILPTWFPYRLNEVAGTVQYSNGRFQLRNLSATHEETQVSINGACGVAPDGSWTVQLPNVIADRIYLNRDLLAALPKELGKAVERLNLRGDLCLQGSLAFSGIGGEPPSTAWDVTVDVEDGSLQCGFAVDHLHGDVHLVGSSSNGTFSSRGELHVDSAMYRDIQLTNLHGPLYVDAAGILFGFEADADAQGRPPRPLLASAVGGQLSADIRVGFEPEIPFRVEVRLDRGDLAEFSREMALKGQTIRGQANALITLSGNRFGRSSWRGTGAVRLFDADIYEIPVMLALLKLLSIRQPDTTAFTNSEIDFRVQGEHVYLDRINFYGDAISLKGSGEMDLDRRIDLKFYSLVGRGEVDLPVVRAVVRQASKQLLLIHVTGTLDDPQLTRDPLPLLKGTLEQIFPEAAAGQVFASQPPLGIAAPAPVRR